MSEVIKNRYSDKDLEEFKVLIEEKIEKAKQDLELLKRDRVLRYGTREHVLTGTRRHCH